MGYRDMKAQLIGKNGMPVEMTIAQMKKITDLFELAHEDHSIVDEVTIHLYLKRFDFGATREEQRSKVIELSSQLPDVLFFGDWSENQDRARDYIRNGEWQTVRQIVAYEPCKLMPASNLGHVWPLANKLVFSEPGAFGYWRSFEETLDFFDDMVDDFDSNDPEHVALAMAWCKQEGPDYADKMGDLFYNSRPHDLEDLASQIKKPAAA